MKPGLTVGHCYEFSLTVREEMKAQFDAHIVHPLYSTAAMITHMEWAARQHILPYLETDEEGVGYHIDVKHLKPTPIGATVRIRSTVTHIEPRRVTSLVEAWNETEKIGEGSLTQALVPVEKIYAHFDQALPAPASLQNGSKETGFSLEILKWETGGLACTRYDEWLICRLNVNQKITEGAFLLRYEIEEWIDAMHALAAGQQSLFQSDFLEPVLNVCIEGTEPGEFQAKLVITNPNSKDDETPTGALKLDLSKSKLQQFADQLARQLVGFPSKQ